MTGTDIDSRTVRFVYAALYVHLRRSMSNPDTGIIN